MAKIMGHFKQKKSQPMKLRKQKAFGNTITEYLFIAVLVLGTFSIACTMFGDGMNKVSNNLKSEFKSRAEKASTQRKLSIQQSELSASNPTSQAFQAMTVDSFGQIRLVPTNPFTAGANGSDMLRSVLYQSLFLDPVVAAQKQEQDENLIRELANISHQVAELEEHLARLSSYSNGDVDRLERTQIMVDGEVLGVNALASRLEETATRVSEQSAQVEQNVLDREAVNVVVERANEVVNQATEVSSTTREVLNRRGHPSDISATASAEDTHEDASFICRHGRRIDNGKKCLDYKEDDESKKED